MPKHFRQWTDHRFTLGKEIYARLTQPVGFFDAMTDVRVDNLLADIILWNFWDILLNADVDDLWWELEIEVSSSGYYDPATWRDPAEGSDERSVVAVHIRPAFAGPANGYNKNRTVALLPEQVQAVEGLYWDEIKEYEFSREPNDQD